MCYRGKRIRQSAPKLSRPTRSTRVPRWWLHEIRRDTCAIRVVITLEYAIELGTSSHTSKQ
ncbi:unnamed protein product [Trichogramma brassicae]|uniref:Uncharacterized protein n=1 Tax=Trichogramma brassicae TaxID=86971 RepID=A0A6H5I7V4_9HYME|nr:unnamed protein product [Trichogramma brassicae]